MQKQRLIGVLLLLLAFGLSACGPKAFTDGKYVDPNEIALLSDKFNENDMQLIVKKLVNSLAAAKTTSNLGERPVIAVGKVSNRTSEHINVKLLTDKLRAELIQAREFRFIDIDSRGALQEEYDYNKGGNVDDQTVKGPKQIAVRYLITGNIGNYTQTVGNDKLIYYKMTLNLTDTSTNEIVWTDFKEIRKKFEKQTVGI